VGGALLCPGCIALAEEEERLRAEQEALETKAETSLVLKSVEKTILWSWIITAVLACVPVGFTFFSFFSDIGVKSSALVRIALCPLYIYVPWSWYWGRIFILDRWGRKIEKATSGKHGWILGLILLFFVAPNIGFYGGGVYQYLKYRKVIKQGD